jgi:hypothetical protein
MADDIPIQDLGARRAAVFIGGALALAAGVTALVVSLWSASAGDGARASCAEGRLAAARAYRADPGLAVAIGRSIAATHPALRGIVDGAADHAARRPDVVSVTLDAGAPAAEASLTYVTTLVDLADHPSLATPEVIATLERAAAAGGLAGVHGLVTDPGIRPRSPAGRAALDRLRGLLARQQAAVAGAGMVSLPSPSCPAT